jgi:hypothetical protein
MATIGRFLSGLLAFCLLLLLFGLLALALAETGFQNPVSDRIADCWPGYSESIQSYATHIAIIAFILSPISFLLRRALGQKGLGADEGNVEHLAKVRQRYLRGAVARQQIQEIRVVLRGDIERQNASEQWDPSDFSPLTAEVEVSRDNNEKRKLSDLLSAFRRHRHRQALLLIGEPGSGKSVALRGLALRNLEAGSNKRIPIYVNLREWSCEDVTAKSLRAYVKRVAMRCLDGDNERFLEDHFENLLEQGRLLLLLDSFDEIPGLLSSHAEDRLLLFQNAIADLFCQKRNRRGILAARPLLGFRPDLGSECVTFELRPFDDESVKRTLQWRPVKRTLQWRQDPASQPIFDDALLTQLFMKQNLVAVARNPFYASLLRAYVERHPGRLPDNQLQLFNTYLETLLKQTAGMRRERGLDDQLTVTTCIAVADVLFDQASAGAYPPLSVLIDQLSDLPVRDVIMVLGVSRLFRHSERLDADVDPTRVRIGFIHRRFQEFLIAKSLLTGRRGLEVASSVDDPAWSDVLILYCQVCDPDTAVRIVRRCWEQVKPIRGQLVDPRSIPAHAAAIRNLQFLTNAFGIGSNTAALSLFQQQIDTVFQTAFRPRETADGEGRGAQRLHRLTAGFLLDATPLASPDTVAVMLSESLASRSPWLSEKAFRSCKNVSEVSFELERDLREHVDVLSLRGFLKQRSNLIFALSLAEAFRPVRLYVWTKWGQIVSRSAALLLLLFCWVLGIVDERLQPVAVVLSLALASVVSYVLLLVPFVTFWKVLRRRRMSGASKVLPALLESFSKLMSGVALFLLPSFVIWAIVPSEMDLALADRVVLLTLGVVILFLISWHHWLWGLRDWLVGRGSGLVGFGLTQVAINIALVLGAGALFAVLSLVQWMGGRSELNQGSELFGISMLIVSSLFLSGSLLFGMFYVFRVLLSAVSQKRTEKMDGTGWITGRSPQILKSRAKQLWPFRYLHDLFLWQRLKGRNVGSCEDIESSFRGLRTPAARLRYVKRKLETLPKSPSGSWVSACPDLGDPASEKLAKLEEKWTKPLLRGDRDDTKP